MMHLRLLVPPFPSKKAMSRNEQVDEASLTKTVAALLSEMSEIKFLLQTFMLASPIDITQEDEEGYQ